MDCYSAQLARKWRYVLLYFAVLCFASLSSTCFVVFAFDTNILLGAVEKWLFPGKEYSVGRDVDRKYCKHLSL